jgi:hypothetical protein
MGDVSKKNCLTIFLLIKFTFQTLQTDIFWTLSWPFSCDYSFWLRDLKFSMCIKDPINKTCWKNGKDVSNGAPKIKLWNHTKKTHFPVFAKNFLRPWMKLEVEIFVCQFPNPWTLRVSGMGFYTSKCEKSQNHCTLLDMQCTYMNVCPCVYWKPMLFYILLTLTIDTAPFTPNFRVRRSSKGFMRDMRCSSKGATQLK